MGELGSASVADPQFATASGALPNLVIIGAQKCGTTALHHYLDLHPQIAMSKPNELNFFIADRRWPKGIEWYRSHFDPGAPVRGDQSPNYSAYPHDLGVPERMHDTIPDARLIYMVRDPLKRIAAHWIHNYVKHREYGNAAETIMHPNTTYLVRSLYFMQLQRFLKFYDPSRVLVVEQNDLLNRRVETLRRIFKFLDVDPSFEHRGFKGLRHPTKRKRRQTRLELMGNRARRGDGIGSKLPGTFWAAFETGLKGLRRLQPPVEAPDVGAILGPEVLEVLRADARRLQEFSGQSFSHWTLWGRD